jgi:hypothetical protein
MIISSCLCLVGTPAAACSGVPPSSPRAFTGKAEVEHQLDGCGVAGFGSANDHRVAVVAELVEVDPPQASFGGRAVGPHTGG